MNETLTLALAWVAGVMLGGIFFGGLWWTVRKGLSPKWAALCFSGSLLLRTGITVAGFYVVGGGHWERLAACLLGFFMARLAVSWLARTARSPTCLTREAYHAPESR